MIDLKTMPKETAAELLFFLADNEDFSSVEKMGDSDITVEEVRAVLRELASALNREASANWKSFDVKGKGLSKEAKNVISSLSPREEQSLLTAFRLIEKNRL